MAKMYTVEVPVTMCVVVEVKADSKEEAIDKLWEEGFIVEAKSDPDFSNPIEVVDWEWEMHEKITQGNVFSGVINEMDVVAEEDIDEDE